MGDTQTVPVSNPPVTNLKTTVTLSPTIQQKLIQINAPVFAAVAVLKELGLVDAAATLASDKPLTPQTVNISPIAASQLYRALSRVLATDSLAAEVGTLVNSIPPAFRVSHPGMARPMPTRVTSPNQAPRPVPKPTKPATKTTPTKAK